MTTTKKQKKVDKTVHKNGQLKKEIALLMPFLEEPWKDFTLTEIKNIAKNNSHHYVYEALDDFSNNGVLRKEMRGNTNIYQINENCKELDYFTLAEIAFKRKNKRIPLNVIQNIQNKMKDWMC